MRKENSGTRRGTRADQIALICCAPGKNVNARRPLVIQPQLWDLLFPSSLCSFWPMCPLVCTLLLVLILPRTLHGCPYLRFYVRLCVLAPSVRDGGERERCERTRRVLSFTKGQSSDRFIRPSYATPRTFGFAIIGRRTRELNCNKIAERSFEERELREKRYESA